jgi:hypothetical protein
MAFPGVRQVKVLYTTAKRGGDEVGKGQEVLRHASAQFHAISAASARRVVMIPQVDIIITGVDVLTEGATAGDFVNVLAPALSDSAADATNRLVTEVLAASLVDDTIFRAVLAGLAGNRVVAGQPIIAQVDEVGAGTITWAYVQVNYILADAEVSY